MGEYKIPNSTVGKKVTANTPLPRSNTKGTTSSRAPEPKGKPYCLDKAGNIGPVSLTPKAKYIK